MRHTTMRRLAIVAALALAFTSSCRTSSQDEAGAGQMANQPVVDAVPQTGGSLAYAIETDPNGLDPTRNTFDPTAILVANAVYDPLIAFDASGAPRPYLAESLTPNSTFTQWTLKLRPGIRFHNGDPLDAEALITWANALRGSLITGQPAKYITAMTEIDSLTVSITMDRPWASFPALLTGQGGYVVDAKQLADPEGQSHPIGTGPFKMKQWDHGTRISLEKNANYWRAGLPYLDSVVFTVIEDVRARISALQEGDVDVMSASTIPDTNALDALATEQQTAARQGQSTGSTRITVQHDLGATESTFVMLNTSKPPLDDVRVRRALAYATDIPTLASTNGWSPDRLIKGPFAPNSPWYADVKPPSYDLAEARRLVDEYQREKGPITIELSGAIVEGLTQQVAEMWQRAGITVRVEITDVKKSVLTAVGGLYDATVFRYFAALDPDINWHFWTSETIRPSGAISVNMSRLSDPKIDEALTQGRASNDLETRRRAYAVVQQRFADLVPYIWLYRVDWAIASNASVHNVASTTLPDGLPAMPFLYGTHRLTETWIERH